MKKSVKLIIVGVIILLLILGIAIFYILNSTKNLILLSTVVKKGDYIDYPVKYGIESDENSKWRVMYIDNGNVKIISENIAFKYKHEKDSNLTVDNLSNRFLEMAKTYDTKYGIDAYINSKYAISSKCVTKEDIQNYLGREILSSEIFDDDLININKFYWLANKKSTGSVLAINENGYLYDYMNYKFGVRVVVTLNSSVLTNKGDGSINNPYKLVR